MISLSTGLVRSMMTAHGFLSMMERGVIDVFSDERPFGADAATPGIPIARITQDGGAFNPGSSPAYGLRLQESGELGVLTSQGSWVLSGLSDGTPTWFRWYWALSDPKTASVFYPRIDGTVGQDLVLGTNFIFSGQSIQLDAVFMTIPQIDIS